MPIADEEKRRRYMLNYHDGMTERRERLNEMIEEFQAEFSLLPESFTRMKDYMMWVSLHILALRQEMKDLDAKYTELSSS